MGHGWHSCTALWRGKTPPVPTGPTVTWPLATPGHRGLCWWCLGPSSPAQPSRGCPRQGCAEPCAKPRVFLLCTWYPRPGEHDRRLLQGTAAAGTGGSARLGNTIFLPFFLWKLWTAAQPFPLGKPHAASPHRALRAPAPRAAQRGGGAGRAPTFRCLLPLPGDRGSNLGRRPPQCHRAQRLPGRSGRAHPWPLYSRARAPWGPDPGRLLGSPLGGRALAAGSCGGGRGDFCARGAAAVLGVPRASAGGSGGRCGAGGRVV